MSIVIPAGFANVSMVMDFIGDPEPMVCTYGIGLDGPNTSVAAQSIWDDCGEAWAALLNDELTLREVVVTGPTTIGVGTGTAIPGAGTGDTLPQNCAVLVRKSTGQRGRSKRGRMYIPVPGVDNVEQGGFLTTAAHAGFTSNVDAYFGLLNTVDGVTGVYLLHSLVNEAPDLITSFEVDPQLATQRRRLR